MNTADVLRELIFIGDLVLILLCGWIIRILIRLEAVIRQQAGWDESLNSSVAKLLPLLENAYDEETRE